MCIGCAYIAATVCMCRCDSCVCKGVQGSVRVCMHRWCVYCCRGVRVYLHKGASKCAMTGLYCRMDCTALTKKKKQVTPFVMKMDL